MPAAALLLLLYALSPVLCADNAGVRIAGVHYLGDLPTLIADQRGLFREQGLSAQTGYHFSGKRNLQRLRAGETDFALMALTPLVIDFLADPTPARADDPVIIANLVHAVDMNQIAVRAGTDILAPGVKRIGVMQGTNAEFFWWLFRTFHELDPAGIELLDFPVAELPEALHAGRVDAAVLWEPWTSRLRDRLGEEPHILEKSDIYTAKWVVVTRRDTLAAYPGRAAALLEAYRQAIEFIGHEPDAAMRAYSRQFEVDLERLRRNWNTLNYDLSLDWSLIVSLQQQLEWVRRAGYTVQNPGSGVLSLIESAPLRAVAPAASSIPARSPVRPEESR